MIRGRGPANPEQRRLLIKWAKKTPGNLHAKRAEQLGQGKLLAAGVTVTGRTVPNLKKLELFYRRQIVPTSGLNSLETLATARLRAIWSTEVCPSTCVACVITVLFNSDFSNYLETGATGRGC
jgi:hypothetical protein